MLFGNEAHMQTENPVPRLCQPCSSAANHQQMHADDANVTTLLSQAAAGQTDAIQTLLQLHRDRLKRMIAIYFDNRLLRRADPSDVVQETLAEAARRLPIYAAQRPIPFYPWLRRLAQALGPASAPVSHRRRKSKRRARCSQLPTLGSNTILITTRFS